ncbi:MAG: hypothetical protein K2X03_04160 [Bryobacteraceae bacterium]|nr:hypothetical protein [Bryobacteraceae bacterium]
MFSQRFFKVLALVSTLALSSVVAFADHGGPHTTSGFQGPKANTGTATFVRDGGKAMLKVSDDFKVPDTPAPTWRAVDSKGNIYTLEAFKIKAGEKRQVILPPYIKDVVKVQVYCAWAEVLLGEASFSSPAK